MPVENLGLTPGDESFLYWTAFDVESLFRILEADDNWRGSITLDELSKVWNYAEHYLGAEIKVLNLVWRNYIQAAYSVGWVAGARASSLGWPKEPIADPGPLESME